MNGHNFSPKEIEQKISESKSKEEKEFWEDQLAELRFELRRFYEDMLEDSFPHNGSRV